MTEFTDALEALISASNKNQTELAEGLGVSPSYLSDIKNGRRDPTPQFIENLQNVFELSNAELSRLRKYALRERGWNI